MAQIGTFTRIEDGSFSGAIRTLRLDAKVRFVPTDKDTDRAPDLRARRSHRVGAAWKRTARETGREPSRRARRSVLPGPIFATWSRSRRLRARLVALSPVTWEAVGRSLLSPKIETTS